jgi:hypothetical protein
MSVSRQVRVWHRRLSFAVGLQFLMWTASGLIFTWEPIDVVHGDTLLRDPEPPPAVDPAALVPLAQALDLAGSVSWADGAQLAWRRGRWVWLLPQGPSGVRLVDATQGRLLDELSAEAAGVLALDALSSPARIVATTRLDAESGEYRKKPLPVWCVTFDDEQNSNVYIDAHEGTVTTVRTDIWRRFDFFWMLHIMDYSERTDFNTPWLKIVAALGFVTAFSGVWLAVLMILASRRGLDPARADVRDEPPAAGRSTRRQPGSG